jgi:hypothetical protein
LVIISHPSKLNLIIILYLSISNMLNSSVLIQTIILNSSELGLMWLHHCWKVANKAAHVREFFCSSFFFFSHIFLKSMLVKPKFKVILPFIFFYCGSSFLYWFLFVLDFFIGPYLFNYYIKYSIYFFYCCFFLSFS